MMLPMDVALLCPLVTGIVKWKAPEAKLTVVVKATFCLTGPAAGQLAPAQEPLTVAWPQEGEPDRELERASDFVPRKMRADVFIVGHAHASEPNTALPVYVEVKGVPQRLRKHATAMSGSPRTSIPLSATFLCDADGAPVRFAPIPGPRHWRRSLDGSFDFGRFNTAPADQQLPTVASGCRLVLRGLLPDADLCEVRVAPIEPAAYLVPSRAPDAIGQAVPLRCDTLLIDGDRALCTLTWRGEVSEPSDEQAYLVVGARLESGPTWAQVCEEIAEATWTQALQERAVLRSVGVQDGDTLPPPADVRAMAPTLNLPPAAALAEASSRQRRRAITLEETLDVGDDQTAWPFQAADPNMPAPAMGSVEEHVSESLGELPEETIGIATEMSVVEAWPFDVPRASVTGTIVPPPILPPTLPPTSPPTSPPVSSPKTGSQTLSLEDLDLDSRRGGSAMPFIAGPAAPPRARPEPAQVATSDRRLQPRQRSETRVMSDEQMRTLQAQGALPWTAQPSPQAPPSTSQLGPALSPTESQPGAPPPAPSHPTLGGSLSRAMGWALGQPGVPTPNPLAVRSPSPSASAVAPSASAVAPAASAVAPAASAVAPAASAVAPAASAIAPGPIDEPPTVPTFELLPLSRYAAVKAALLDEHADWASVLAGADVSERTWRLNERQMTIELSRESATGGGTLASDLRRAIDTARRQAETAQRSRDDSPSDLAEDIERYCEIRAEIEESDDAAQALRELGLEREAWAKIRRGWSGRCLTDADLTGQIRERLTQARNKLRRQSGE